MTTASPRRAALEESLERLAAAGEKSCVARLEHGCLSVELCARAGGDRRFEDFSDEPVVRAFFSRPEGGEKE